MKGSSLHKQKYFICLFLSWESILWSGLISLSKSHQAQLCINTFPCTDMKDEATIGALTADTCQSLQAAIEMALGGSGERKSLLLKCS